MSFTKTTLRFAVTNFSEKVPRLRSRQFANFQASRRLLCCKRCFQTPFQLYPREATLPACWVNFLSSWFSES